MCLHGPVAHVKLPKKHDRELIELLNELRVVLPGVQVLFAFLLIVPFTERFDDDGAARQTAYMVGLLATLVATILLIAPSAYHRLRWRERDKEQMLRTSNRLAIAGLAFVAVAMTASVYLVSEAVVHTTGAVLITCFSAVLFATAWFVLPLSRPYERWDDELEDAETVGSTPTQSLVEPQSHPG